jgi:HK97 family phage prohead protease
METRHLEIFGAIGDGLELRLAEGEQPNRLVGYAAVFNSLSSDLGGFKERISPGAFRTSVAGSADVRALVDHDPSKLLGRTSSGTLRIAEDEHGLRVEIDLPDTSYARDVRTMVQRRDVRGMSFGFKVREGGQRFSKEGGQIVRELSSIDLKEVTVTSVPAYGATSLSLRVDPSLKPQIEAADGNLDWQAANKRLLLRTTM